MTVLQSSLATLLIFGAAAITNVSYAVRHRRNYRDGRQKVDAHPAFSPATDLYLRFSTVILGVASSWLDTPLLIQIHKGTVAFVLGCVLTACAEALFLWSMAALGNHYSPCYDSHVPTALVSSGPYRRIRHPIYTANIALIFAITLMTGTALLLVNTVILALGYLRAARQEENYLATAYPSYHAYIQATGMFLPHISNGTHVA